MMMLRGATREDCPALLGLNAASVRVLSELDQERLQYILSLAHRCLVVESDGEVVAFALALAPDTRYDSKNYRWFGERYERFLYLDRIAVAAPHRRRGIGALLYDSMEATAAPLQRIVCDVNIDPPNEVSLAFHAARGFQEVGRLAHGDVKVVALMSKELARAS
jgi:predicted GNAT superfamily acetyltransferase